MNAITDIFSGIKQFMDVVPGIEASKELSEMEPAYEVACTRIQDVITLAIFDIIKAELTAAPSGGAVIANALLYLQGAVGNYTMYQHLIFDVISKKKEEQNLYKYELHEMQEAYLDNFANYMDRLLTLMDNNTGSFTGWTDTDIYIDRAKLVLKSSKDFAKWYGTAGSEYFVMRTIYKQHEIIDENILPRMTLAEITGELEAPVKRYVAYSVVASAIRELDYPDLPKSLRNDIYNESSKKQGYQEQFVKERLWKTYEAKAEKYLNKVDLILNRPDADITTIIVNEGLNAMEDKTFLMG